MFVYTNRIIHEFWIYSREEEKKTSRVCAFVHLNLFLFHRCCKEIASFIPNAQRDAKKQTNVKRNHRKWTINSQIPRSVLDLFKVSISFVSLKHHFGRSLIQSTMTTKMIKANEDLFIFNFFSFSSFSIAKQFDFFASAQNGQVNQYANDRQNANYLTFTSWSQGTF